MALCFAGALDILLQRIVQERLLKEFSTTRFPKPPQTNLTAETWCPKIVDSTTPLEVGGDQSLKKLLFDHFIGPRLPQASPDPKCVRLISTPSPMMPELRVMDGPTRSGLSSRMESSLKSPSSRSSGNSTR